MVPATLVVDLGEIEVVPALKMVLAVKGHYRNVAVVAALAFGSAGTRIPCVVDTDCGGYAIGMDFVTNCTVVDTRHLTFDFYYEKCAAALGDSLVVLGVVVCCLACFACHQ